MAARKRRTRESAAKPQASADGAATSPRKEKATRRFSDAERQRILTTAEREGLTGNQVAKKFGISTVTYYLWRKKTGSTTRGRRRSGRAARPRVDAADFSGQLREAVRARVREMLPEIIAQEIGASLGERTGRGR